MKIKQPPIFNSPLLLFPFFILLFSFFSCKNPIIQKIVEPKTVTFETNGGSRVEDQTVFRNQPVKRPPDPSKIDHRFAAWYTDNGTFLKEWNFAAIPSGDMTLYAKWIATGVDGTEIPAAAVTIAGPAKGAAPGTQASKEGSFAEYFTVSAVSWTPDDNPFKGLTVYTVTVTLTANSGYTFAANVAATINGSSETHVVNNGTTLALSHTFAATSDKTVSSITVAAQPTKREYTHGDTLTLAGLVVTLHYDDVTGKNVDFDDFEENNITPVLPAHGAKLSHTAHDGKPVVVHYGDLTANTDNLTVSPKAITFDVEPIPDQTFTGDSLKPTVTVRDGGTILALDVDYTVEYADNTNAGTAAATITGRGNYQGSTGSAPFTINKAAITTAAVTVAAPAKGDTPDTTASGTGNFTAGSVSWSPSHSPFQGDEIYTASVTLTANTNYTFTGIITATINGHTAGISNNTGETATLSFTFDATEALAVTNIVIVTLPTLTYIHGDTLNLSGLVIQLVYEDYSTGNNIQFNDFPSTISTNLADGTPLVHVTHNNMPVTVTYGGSHTQNIGNLAVSKAAGAAVSAPSITGNAAELTVSVSTLAGLLTATGQSIEYAIHDGSVLSAWGSGTTFTGLSTSTAYTVHARSAENDNYSAGASSASAAAITFYRAAFNINGGGGTTPASQTVNAGSSITLPTSGGFSRTNYTFAGWNTESDGSGTDYNSGSAYTLTGDTTLYAKWVENTATISITVEDIEEGVTTDAGTIVISRTGANKTRTITVDSPSDYSSIAWEISGVGIYAGQKVESSGSTFTLDAANVKYNSVGIHTLKLTVIKGGVQYMVNIEFTVVN